MKKAVPRPSMDTPPLETVVRLRKDILWMKLRRSYEYISQHEPVFQALYAGSKESVAIPLPAINPGDWLAEHEEPGQSFEEFMTGTFGKSRCAHNVDPELNPICLVALGDLKLEQQQLNLLTTYVSTFFQRRVIVLEAVGEAFEAAILDRNSEEAATKKPNIIRSRMQEGMRQLWIKDCIKFTRNYVQEKFSSGIPVPTDIGAGSAPIQSTNAAGVPKIAGGGGTNMEDSPAVKVHSKVDVLRKNCCLEPCAIMAVTLDDLTLKENWGFLYGLASKEGDVGCLSLARYSPEYNKEKKIKSKAARDHIILQRACKILTHEIGHLFGLKHCINHKCLMNGLNHITELRALRMIECPECTKKLSHGFCWDVEKRFQELGDCTRTLGFDQEAEQVLGEGGIFATLQVGLEAMRNPKSAELPPNEVTATSGMSETPTEEQVADAGILEAKKNDLASKSTKKEKGKNSGWKKAK